MKHFLFPLLFVLHLAGQTITLSGPSSVTAGNSVTASIAISGSSGLNLAALQWSTTLPTGVTLGTPVIATALGTEGYGAYCGPIICLIAGSTTALTDGTLLTIPITVAASVTPGTISLPMTGIFEVNNAGLNVNGAVAGTAYSLKVFSPCDLNQDGVVNITDVQLVISAITSGASCPIASANGGCTLQTVVYEVIAALGGSCKV